MTKTTVKKPAKNTAKPKDKPPAPPVVDFEATVSAKGLAMLYPFLPTAKSHLQHLKGVHIEAAPDGGVVMVATNGWVLGAVKDDNGTVAGVSPIGLPTGTIPVTAELVAAIKAARRWRGDIRVGVKDGSVQLLVPAKGDKTPVPGSVVFPLKLSNRSYVNWRGRIPKYPTPALRNAPAKPAVLDQHTLKPFIEAQKIAGDSKPQIQVFGVDSNGPMIVEFPNHPKFRGVFHSQEKRTGEHPMSGQLPSWAS